MIISDIPYSIAIYYYQGVLRFKDVLKIKLSLKIIFLILISILDSFFKLTFESLLIIHCLSSFVTSLPFFFNYLLKRQFDFNFNNLKLFVNYGKFTFANLLTTNLLKNTDLYLIAFYFNQADIAIYAIAIKSIDLIEFPIRALMNVIFPKFSKQFGEGNKKEMISLFITTSIHSLMFIFPILILFYMFAPTIINIIGGSNYSESIILFQIFLLYNIILPIDKYSGVLLDSLNKPYLNFKKIRFLFFTNLILDIIVIYIFESLIAIACVSVIMFII